MLGWDHNTLALGSVDLRITDTFYVALVIWLIFARRRDPDGRGADVGQRQLVLWFLGLAISLYPVIILGSPGDLTEPLLAVLRLVETLSLVWIVPYVARSFRDLRVIFGVLSAVLTYEVGRSIISSGLSGTLSDSLEGANNKNAMGLLAAVLVILAIVAPLLPRSGRAVMLVVGLSGVVLARSIGSIAALAIVVAFFGVTSQSRARDTRRARRLLTLPRLLVVVAIGLMLTSVLRPENVASSASEINQSTTVHRQVLATAGLQLFIENPIVGVGWARGPAEIGSVRIDEVLRKQFSSVNPEFFPRKNPTNVHNAYVEVIAETGIVGLVLFLIFVVTAFRRIRAHPQRPQSEWRRVGLRPMRGGDHPLRRGLVQRQRGVRPPARDGISRGDARRGGGDPGRRPSIQVGAAARSAELTAVDGRLPARAASAHLVSQTKDFRWTGSMARTSTLTKGANAGAAAVTVS